MEEPTPIQTFYKDQTVFITGGTGFIGKVLIEKLLRTCSDLRVIYVMVRPRKGKSANQRFSEIFGFPCFDALKSQMPDFAEKVRLVSGDCEQPGLGLSSRDREILSEETNIFVHSAANVRFDQQLRLAALANIKAVDEVLRLAREMKNLKALVHLSTAYSNCHRRFIDERLYKPGVETKGLFALLEGVDDESLDAITPDLIKGWPNTYTYTKCIAEDLIRREGEDLPVVIVRPSMICASAKEPIPGWVDNFNGMSGIGVGFFLGVIRSLNAVSNTPLHIVPCDFVVNNIIASAWHLQTSRFSDRKLIIYNYSGSKEKTVTIGYMVNALNRRKWVYPTPLMIWFPCLTIVENAFWYEIQVFFQLTVASYILDFVLLCLGKKTIAVNKFQQIKKLQEVTKYFLRNTWNFKYENVKLLSKKMSEKDQELFQVSMDEFDVDEYITNSVKNARIYLLNESVEKIPEAKRKLKVFFVVHYAVVAILWFLILGIIFNIINICMGLV